jgi:hypothetical protein
MSQSIASLSLVSVSVEDVRAALRTLVRSDDAWFDLRLSVVDVVEAGAFADAFMAQQGLRDESFVASFQGITVNVAAFAPPGSLAASVAPVLMDHLGKELSRAMRAMVVLDLAGGTQAFRVYRLGLCVIDKSDSCRELLARLTGWVPVKGDPPAISTGEPGATLAPTP